MEKRSRSPRRPRLPRLTSHNWHLSHFGQEILRLSLRNVAEYERRRNPSCGGAEYSILLWFFATLYFVSMAIIVAATLIVAIHKHADPDAGLALSARHNCELSP